MSKKKSEPKEKFTCRFSDGTSLSFSVDLEELRAILNSRVIHLNTPRLRKSLIPEYIKWMHGVMSTLASRLGEPINYGYPDDDREEVIFFTYLPDGTYHEIPEG